VINEKVTALDQKIDAVDARLSAKIDGVDALEARRAPERLLGGGDADDRGDREAVFASALHAASPRSIRARRHARGFRSALAARVAYR
jgi:hypothetical protein